MHECWVNLSNHISVLQECNRKPRSALGGCGPMPGKAGLNALLKDW